MNPKSELLKGQFVTLKKVFETQTLDNQKLENLVESLGSYVDDLIAFNQLHLGKWHHYVYLLVS